METTSINRERARIRTTGLRAALAALCISAVASAGTFGRVVPIGGLASDLALDEPRGVLYVANFTARRIEVVSLSDGSRRQPIRVEGQPGTVDVSADRKYLIAGHYGNFSDPLSPENGVTLVDLTTRSSRYLSLAAPVLGTGFGFDGRALIVTNKEFLLLDPVSGNVENLGSISDVNAQDLPVDLGKAPPDITEASMAISEDRSFIYILGGHARTATWKYDVKTRTVLPGGIVLASGVLGPRVVSMNHNGSRTFAGWVMVDEYHNFSNFYRTVTNEFSIGTTAFDDHRNIVYAQMPKVKGEAPTLMISDYDNLAVLERMRLAENLSGKSLLSKDGNTMYSVSASGVTIFPIGSLTTQHRIVASPEDLVFRGNFCNRTNLTQRVIVTNPGGGATDFSLSTTLPGVTFSRTQGTTPATIDVTMDPLAFQNTKGTVMAEIKVTSAAAVNVIPPIRLLINNRDPDQRGTIVNVPGQLTDIIADPVRDRFYILRQDKNQVLVFDGSNLRQIAALKTYNSPTSLAITFDKKHLLIGHDSSQVAAVYELDTLRQLPYISVEAGGGNVAHHIAVAESGIFAAATDYTDKGRILKLDLETRDAIQLPSLGPFKNEIHTETVATAPLNGKTIFFPSSDGNVLLYDDVSQTFSSRKDFSALNGGYGASNDGNFWVGNHLMNASAVEIGTYDDAGGTTAGVGFLGSVGYRIATTRESDPGTLHRLAGAGRNLELVQPTRTIEAGMGGLPEAKFSRTVAPLSNGRTVIILSVSGFMALPSDYAAATAIPVISSAVSAADLSANVAAGGLVSIFGSKLSGVSIAANTMPIPSVLGESCLMVNDVPAPLLYVSPGQVNAQLPYSIAGDARLVLRTPGGVSSPFTLKTFESAASIFKVSGGSAGTTFPAVIRATNNQLVTLSNPIHRGDAISIYATGLGNTFPPVAAGAAAPVSPLARIADPQISLGGVPLILEFAGLSPGTAGVYQINARIPFQVPLGVNVPLEIQQGTSPRVSVNLRVVD